MCEVLDRAENRGMQKGWIKGRAEGRAEGRTEGRAEGRLTTLLELVHDGILSLPEAAARANLSEQEFSQKAEACKRLT